MKRTKKIEKEIEPHWQKLVGIFFSFCLEKFKAKPTFDRSAPRDLKDIVKAIRVRAQENNIEWDEKNAVDGLRDFLNRAYLDDWLSRNFLLFNLNRFKDKVFLNLITTKNGSKFKRGFVNQPNPDDNTKGDFINL